MNVKKYIEENFGREVVMVGASTGTDAHTVGIDAIMKYEKDMQDTMDLKDIKGCKSLQPWKPSS